MHQVEHCSINFDFVLDVWIYFIPYDLQCRLNNLIMYTPGVILLGNIIYEGCNKYLAPMELISGTFRKVISIPPGPRVLRKRLWCLFYLNNALKTIHEDFSSTSR